VIPFSGLGDRTIRNRTLSAGEMLLIIATCLVTITEQLSGSFAIVPYLHFATDPSWRSACVFAL